VNVSDECLVFYVFRLRTVTKSAWKILKLDWKTLRNEWDPYFYNSAFLNNCIVVFVLYFGS